MRHGETLQNAERRMVSTDDPSLSTSGAAHVAELARSLAGVRIDRIVTSPLTRCRETADAVIAARFESVALDVDDRLRELRFGAIEGMNPEEIAAAGLAQVFNDWRQGLPPRYPEGAETFEDAALRLRLVYDDVTAHGGETVLLVGHSHALRILLATCVLGVAAEAHRRLRIDHGTVSEVGWESRTPRLLALNATSVPASR